MGDTTPYLGITLDKELTWSPHIDQVRRRTAQRTRLLCFLLNRSDLSIINGVLLYKQLIPALMDYACTTWRSAALTHFGRLQVLQSKCLRLVMSSPWYVINRQLHEDLSDPPLADHIRALTESFESKLADAGNPLVRQLVRYLNWPRVAPVTRRANRVRRGTTDQSRPLHVGDQID
jgi:hypothetical protein